MFVQSEKTPKCGDAVKISDAIIHKYYSNLFLRVIQFSERAKMTHQENFVFLILGKTSRKKKQQKQKSNENEMHTKVTQKKLIFRKKITGLFCIFKDSFENLYFLNINEVFLV